MSETPETDMAASGAPAEMWVRPDFDICRSAPFADAVRYVRGDIYDALVVRLAGGDAPCRLEPQKLWRGMGALLDFGPYRPL